jgi:translation initiation factor 1 (eIF-1/SUI1)
MLGRDADTYGLNADAVRGTVDSTRGVDIRFQKRKKGYSTYVEGLFPSGSVDAAGRDLAKTFLRFFKRKHGTNGSVMRDDSGAAVLHFHGDQRDALVMLLAETGMAEPDRIRVHGIRLG